jgi:hypothetical protein
VNAGEGELSLRLDSDRGEGLGTQIQCPLPGVAEQRRLADARLAAHDQRSASPFDVIDEPVDDPRLGSATDQVGRGHGRRIGRTQRALRHGRPRQASAGG